MSRFIKNKPTGILRWALHAPRWLYHSGLGWMVGNRFLLLSYVGRRSGLDRETVIEIVDHDKESDTFYVASGWGTKADWFQSIRANPDVKIQVGMRKILSHAQVVDFEAAAYRLSTYAKNHPAAFRELSGLLVGKVLRGTQEECRELARTVPVIAFRPKRG